MKIKLIVIGLTAICLCGAKAEKAHPLNLLIPSPNRATHTAWFLDTPDETILVKVASLESAARKAHPDTKPWSIYLTPQAANIKIKGWKYNPKIPDQPIGLARLDDCIQMICNLHPKLQYEVIGDKILISAKKKKTEQSTAELRR